MRRQLRFAALGDSTTFGVGDPVASGWRGWAPVLADALAEEHDLDYRNLSASGGTTRDVWETQVPAAVAMRPHVASLVVGVNDTMKSSWDAASVSERLVASADALAAAGALLITVRYHDHARVLGLPGWLRRPMWARIEVLNSAYDQIHERHGGVRLDLAQRAEVQQRGFWSVDRLHPSQSGHRAVARWAAEGLAGHGIAVSPAAILDVPDDAPAWHADAAWLVRAGLPWLARKAGDLGPWGARMAIDELVAAAVRRRGRPATLPAALPTGRPAPD